MKAVAHDAINHKYKQKNQESSDSHILDYGIQNHLKNTIAHGYVQNAGNKQRKTGILSCSHKNKDYQQQNKNGWNEVRKHKMEHHVVKRDKKSSEGHHHDKNTMCKMRKNNHRAEDSQEILQGMSEERDKQEKCGISETIPSEEKTNTGNTKTQNIYRTIIQNENDIKYYIGMNLEQNLMPNYTHMFIIKS